MANFITQVWEIPWSMWEHRNTILHSPQHPSHIQQRSHTWTAIESQLELGDTHLLPQHQYLLHTPRERMHNWTHEQQQQWLTTVELARMAFTNTTTPDPQSLQETLGRWNQEEQADTNQDTDPPTVIHHLREPPPLDIEEPPEPHEQPPPTNHVPIQDIPIREINLERFGSPP